MLMVWLYNLGLAIYGYAIRIAALFLPKARQWVEGRKNIFKSLQKKIDPKRPVIWMHCASLGEFEQGRPVLEKLRSAYPHYQIVLSFFSPSGYEIRKDYSHADVVTYLPLDSSHNAKQWLEIVQPQVAIFVKYEFWYHYLKQLKNQDCTCLLISATFRSSQIFFQPYGSFFRKILHSFDHIFVQEEKDRDLLLQIQLPSVSVAGDTRIDRVLEMAKKPGEFPLVAAFTQDHPILILGSSWPVEEKLFADFLKSKVQKGWKYIIAPHDISETHLQAIEKVIPLSILRYSKASASNIKDHEALLIDNIGMLSSLYQYGRIAFIGGGFGTGIHNILEPIAFGLPVVFGPKYHKFGEARALVKSGGAFSIEHTEEFSSLVHELSFDENYFRASSQVKNYLEKHRGATQKILSFLEGILA